MIDFFFKIRSKHLLYLVCKNNEPKKDMSRFRGVCVVVEFLRGGSAATRGLPVEFKYRVTCFDFCFFFLVIFTILIFNWQRFFFILILFCIIFR